MDAMLGIDGLNNFKKIQRNVHQNAFFTIIYKIFMFVEKHRYKSSCHMWTVSFRANVAAKGGSTPEVGFLSTG